MPAPVTAYRVLLFDDEAAIHSIAEQQLRPLIDSDRVRLSHASTESEAVEHLRDHYVDLVLLDLEGRDGSLSGLEILAQMAEFALSSDVIMITHVELHHHAKVILQVVARAKRPSIIDFVDKFENDQWAYDAVVPSLTRHESLLVDLAGADTAVRLLSTRRSRFPNKSVLPLRHNPIELEVEFERLSRTLFGRTSNGVRSSGVKAELDELASVGLSAAITLHASVTLTFNDVSAPTTPYDCVVKAGPRADVIAEVSKYEEFVRFGVPLHQRVELLSVAQTDSLAAVAYSLAGGSTDAPLVALDDLLRTNDDTTHSVFEQLFKTTNWYSVPANHVSPHTYMKKTYGVDFSRASDRNVASLAKLADTHRLRFLQPKGANAGAFYVGSVRLPVPETAFLGEGAMLQPRPCCLVHGDMHGGNVLVELQEPDRNASSRRVYLIDYQSAGPGPRCIDAAALEASIRLADAHLLGSQAPPDSLKQLELCARRFDSELQFYRAAWTAGATVPSAPWARMSLQVISGLRDVFDNTLLSSFNEPVSLNEYVHTALLYGLRQLQYDLTPHARIRLLAWVGALYTLYRESYPRPDSKAITPEA